jgi:hypothetical protein
MIPIDDAEHATLLASLRHFQDCGQGDPFSRTDKVHRLATNNDQVASSLDAQGIEQLFRKLKKRAAVQHSAPTDDEGWMRLGVDRGWSPAVLSHAKITTTQKTSYEDETVIELAGGFELRCPAFPQDCDYVRVVDSCVAGGAELMCWTSQEWAEAPEEVMGAILRLARSAAPFSQLAARQAQPDAVLAAERNAFSRAARVCESLAGSKWVSIEAANEIRDAIERVSLSPEPCVSYHRTARPGQMAVLVCEILGLSASNEDSCEAQVEMLFPKADWQYEVGNGDTTAGYWEWALSAAEERAHEQQQSEHREASRA